MIKHEYEYTKGPYSISACGLIIMTDYRDEYGNMTEDNWHHCGHPKILAQNKVRKWQSPSEANGTLKRFVDCANACEGIPLEGLNLIKKLYENYIGEDND